MGISGLLPLLKEVQVNGHISNFKGKKMAVDGYVWLHRGAFGCAEALVKGKRTTKFVDYALHRVRILRHHGVEPFIVLDGGPLPAKRGTEVSRARSRADNLDKAKALEAQGRHKEARDAYTKCVDITPEMAYQLIKALRAENVDYVVAPYEADAQLCFLEREGYVDGIITEDSDLLVFGCRQVVFKLDSNGDCVWIQRDRLATCREFPMHGWTDVQFRRMAMLSGCDYLDSIPGIGLKKAHRLMRRFASVEKIIQHLRLEGSLVPQTYAADFALAELAFLHQRVFHPELCKLVPLNPLPEAGLGEEGERWVGEDIEEGVARGMARGDVNPETRVEIVDEWPDFKPEKNGNGKVGGGGRGGGGKKGTLDGFVQRVKRPTVLPRPIGAFGSGASRLSDQIPISSLDSIPTTSSEDLDQPPAGRKSKFFSKKESTPELGVKLLWEDDSEDEAQLQSSMMIDTQRAGTRSPSPAVSSLKAGSSPARLVEEDDEREDEDDGEDGRLSETKSPSVMAISSPPCSSPLIPKIDKLAARSFPRNKAAGGVVKREKEESGLFTPKAGLGSRGDSFGSEYDAMEERKRGRGTLRVSRVLEPTASRDTIVPASSSPPLPQSEPSPAPPITSKPLSRQPPRRRSDLPSSDSIDSEELATPSHSHEPTSSQKKRKRSKVVEVEEEEMDKVEVERKEKAKVLAGGWRMKYAFGGQSSASPPEGEATPKPRGRGSIGIARPASTPLPAIAATKSGIMTNGFGQGSVMRTKMVDGVKMTKTNSSSSSTSTTFTENQTSETTLVPTSLPAKKPIVVPSFGTASTSRAKALKDDAVFKPWPDNVDTPTRGGGSGGKRDVKIGLGSVVRKTEEQGQGEEQNGGGEGRRDEDEDIGSFTPSPERGPGTGEKGVKVAGSTISRLEKYKFGMGTRK
ncbi:hypothetical protein L198_07461 [Cryptococcus wingfieldii CBS 7118]|uniref:Uncharacterized protein n=1 Tax=Cryptococcus wingfieldii CBS 7118 TaxID=1295528 RepID=A0A1E3IB98_9TREE|nr:hypothetical protein L198_07461 [Cryptococcus wingfieldii CBS 7118]ODN85893.1 hypothetical protein L198_07461 [Cryptococcus wingfieldii CBS 7118]